MDATLGHPEMGQAMSDQGDVYEIHIEGRIGTSWAAWFDNLTIRHTAAGDTLLSGHVEDQAALHGVLAKIRDLGLPLVTVRRLDSQRGGCANGSLTDGS